MRWHSETSGFAGHAIRAGLAPMPWRARGLTLIELMVVVAVIAILATIVYPAYERLIQSVRRGDGRAIAHAVALAEERYFTVNGRYNVTPASIFPDPASYDCTPPLTGFCSEKEYYTFTVGAGGTGNIATSFEVTVLPVSTKSQRNDEFCTQLSLDSTGVVRGRPDSANDGKCWPQDYAYDP